MDNNFTQPKDNYIYKALLYTKLNGIFDTNILARVHMLKEASFTLVSPASPTLNFPKRSPPPSNFSNQHDRRETQFSPDYAPFKPQATPRLTQTSPCLAIREGSTVAGATHPSHKNLADDVGHKRRGTHHWGIQPHRCAYATEFDIPRNKNTSVPPLCERSAFLRCGHAHYTLQIEFCQSLFYRDMP